MSSNSQLIDILEQKIECLKEMRDVTEQCGNMLESDDIDGFSKGIEAREGIIGKIDAFSKMEKQYPAADDAQILVLKQEFRGIIQEIILLDDRVNALAEAKMELYKTELKSMNQQKQGIDRYINAYQKTDAFYFDEKK